MLAEGSGALRTAVEVDRDPMVVENAIAMLDRIDGEVVALSAALPASPDLDPAAGEALDDLQDVLTSWSADLDAALASLDERADEFSALLAEWVAGGPSGPPPIEYTDLVDVGLIPNPTCTPACAALVLALDETADCNITPGSGPDGGAPGAMPIDELAVTVGETTMLVGPLVAIEVFDPPGLLGIDLDPQTTLTISTPPDVIAPGTEPTPGGLTQPARWPEDLASWSTGLPVEVESSGRRSVGATSYEVVDLAGTITEPVVVIANDFHPEGGIAIAEGRILRIYSGVIGDEPIAVVLQSFERPDLDVVLDQVDDIVATIRPANG